MNPLHAEHGRCARKADTSCHVSVEIAMARLSTRISCGGAWWRAARSGLPQTKLGFLRKLRHCRESSLEKDRYYDRYYAKDAAASETSSSFLCKV